MKSSACVISAWIPAKEKELIVHKARENNQTTSQWISEQLKQAVSQERRTNEAVFTSDSSDRERFSTRKELKLRLLASEMNALEKAAETECTSKQNYVIRALRSSLCQSVDLKTEQFKALLASNSELRKIGVNLNQIAKHLNSIEDYEIDNQLLSDISLLLKNLGKEINRHTNEVKHFVIGCRERNKLTLLPAKTERQTENKL